jgi:hypothetical protein
VRDTVNRALSPSALKPESATTMADVGGAGETVIAVLACDPVSATPYVAGAAGRNLAAIVCWPVAGALIAVEATPDESTGTVSATAPSTENSTLPSLGAVVSGRETNAMSGSGDPVSGDAPTRRDVVVIPEHDGDAAEMCTIE